MSKEVAEEQDLSSEPVYLKIQDVARLLRCSVDTLRRYIIDGRVKGIEWIDFFGNGKLRATRESVEGFIRDRRQATERIYSQLPKKSRAGNER